jgi:Domain of unknown function (DUF4349)
MERSSEYEDVAVALAEVKPTPRTGFAAELDELVAAGFPRKSRFGRLPTIAARARGLSPQRLLVATGAATLTAIAIATVVISNTGSDPAPIALEQPAARRSSDGGGVQYSEALPQVAGSSVESSAGGERYERAPGGSFSSESRSAPATDQALRATHREIERSAEIGLLADPADVGEDSARIFSTVHDVRGIVLHSTTTAGRHAGAHFDLLIPSARLGDALAAFSAIDEVRTRHEATADITAPTVALGEQLRDSRAKVDGLLAQLSTAETESEREAIEIGLRHERHHAVVLQARLGKLQRRADYSRVSLRIETGESATDSTGGAWGIDDAFGDAGRILGVAAAFTVIGLAIVAPLALIVILAWLTHRLWLRTRRERALDA